MNDNAVAFQSSQTTKEWEIVESDFAGDALDPSAHPGTGLRFEFKETSSRFFYKNPQHSNRILQRLRYSFITSSVLV